MLAPLPTHHTCATRRSSAWLVVLGMPWKRDFTLWIAFINWPPVAVDPTIVRETITAQTVVKTSILGGRQEDSVAILQLIVRAPDQRGNGHGSLERPPDPIPQDFLFSGPTLFPDLLPSLNMVIFLQKPGKICSAGFQPHQSIIATVRVCALTSCLLLIVASTVSLVMLTDSSGRATRAGSRLYPKPRQHSWAPFVGCSDARTSLGYLGSARSYGDARLRFKGSIRSIILQQQTTARMSGTRCSLVSYGVKTAKRSDCISGTSVSAEFHFCLGHCDLTEECSQTMDEELF